MQRRATITGWGKCRPPVSLTNHDLEQFVDTDDSWTVERTGISSRGINHTETTDMAEVAATRALAAAGLAPTDIDLLIFATVTPEITCPSNACHLQERMGAVNSAAFDLNAACSGFVYAAVTASSLIAAGVHDRVLVVGAEQLHWVMDYHDRNTCILFGDGAGAAVFEASTAGDGMLGADLGADGVAGSTMVFESLGTRYPLLDGRSPATSKLHFEGQAVFKIAVRGIADSVERAMSRGRASRRPTSICSSRTRPTSGSSPPPASGSGSIRHGSCSTSPITATRRRRRCRWPSATRSTPTASSRDRSWC